MANRLTRIVYPLLELLPEPAACKLKVLAQVLLRDYRFLNPSYHSYPHAAKFTNFPPEYADTEFRGLDPESRRIARDYLRRCRNINVLQNLPLPQELFLVHHSRLREHVILPPPETRQLRQTRRRFRLTGGAESLIFHQGVALLPESVKKRLAGTDFVDAGAYLGNYTIPLLQYQPRRIFAFEPSRISGNKLLANLSRASIPKDRVEWIQAGLATTERICRFADFGSGDQRLDQPGTEEIPLYRLDDFAIRRNLRLGLLKTDVEGMGVELLLGALETIRRDRPVLALSIYHTPEEFFRQYAILREAIPAYHYRITDLPPGSGFELTLLAWPEEADDISTADRSETHD